MNIFDAVNDKLDNLIKRSKAMSDKIKFLEAELVVTKAKLLGKESYNNGLEEKIDQALDENCALVNNLKAGRVVDAITNSEKVNKILSGE